MIKRKKIILGIIIMLIAIFGWINNAYAATGELIIEDSTEKTGYEKKDDKLYYVVSIKAKTVGTDINSVSFELKYDYRYLKPIKLEKGEKLNLNSKGEFTTAVREETKEIEGWSVDINNLIYMGQVDYIEPIKLNEINLISVCFEVLDNKQDEKRAVYIDKKDSKTKITGVFLNTEERYITNGVDKSKIEELENPKEDNNDNITIDYESKEKEEEEEENETVNEITSKNEKKQDETISKGQLPNTGIKTILVMITVVGIIGIVAYIKNRKYKGI